MKIYWIYEIPEWLFGTLTVAVFVAFGLAGLYLTRRWVHRLDTPEHHAYNHIVGFYFAGVTVLYAVCAGLLAIGAWATYSDVQGKVDHEAAPPLALFTVTSVRTPSLRAPFCSKTCVPILARLSTWGGRCNGKESFPTMPAPS